MLVSIRRLAFCQIALLWAALGALALPAFAEVKFPNYLVDVLANSCTARKPKTGNTVYAFSPIDLGWCAYGGSDLPPLRKEALKRCNAQIPAQFRSKVKCSVVIENGAVVNRALISKFRREVSAPADIEIFDGETGKTERRRGLISTGRYVSWTHQAARITLDDGKLLCEGFRIERSGGVGFEGKCFGKFEFKGSLPRPTGVFIYKGNYVTKISFKMKKGKSYIKVTTGQ